MKKVNIDTIKHLIPDDLMQRLGEKGKMREAFLRYFGGVKVTNERLEEEIKDAGFELGAEPSEALNAYACADIIADKIAKGNLYEGETGSWEVRNKNDETVCEGVVK